MASSFLRESRFALNLKNVRADCNFGVALVAHNSNPGMTAMGLDRVKTLEREGHIEPHSLQPQCPRKQWQADSQTAAVVEHNSPPSTPFRSFYTPRVIFRPKRDLTAIRQKRKRPPDYGPAAAKHCRMLARSCGSCTRLSAKWELPHVRFQIPEFCVNAARTTR